MPPANGPELWLIAGSNGAGKTTLAAREDIRELLGQIALLNPDALASEIASSRPMSLDDANLKAAQRIEEEVRVRVERRESLLVETVLSSPKYLSHVRRAKELGYFIGMIYVALPNPEMAATRVSDRVKFEGGHDVPENKIRERWYRSHEFLAKFTPLLDRLLVFSNANSGGDPVLVARKANNVVEITKRDELPEVERVLSPLCER